MRECSSRWLELFELAFFGQACGGDCINHSKSLKTGTLLVSFVAFEP